MKFINKNPEPQEFQDWKASQIPAPAWKSFSGTEVKQAKLALMNSLLEEQGYICCYCEARISLDDTDIEHVKPRRIDPDAAFDYSNLLLSCNTTEKGQQRTQHCNHRKGGWYDQSLFISPLESDCECCFRYSSNGEVEPTDNSRREQAAKETILHVGLNAPSLTKKRKIVVEEIAKIVADSSPERARYLINVYTDRNGQGKFEPFWSVIRNVFKKTLS